MTTITRGRVGTHQRTRPRRPNAGHLSRRLRPTLHMKLLQQIEQHSQDIRLLLNVPTHTDITLTLTAFREALDMELAALAPVGAIIAWHKDANGNVPTLPVNWVACS